MAEPGSRSSRPLQGIMLLVLLLLASTKASVPAMASVEQVVESALDVGASIIGKTKKEWRKPIMAGKRGSEAGKALGEYQDKQKESEQREYPGGGTTAYVDTVVVDIPAAGTSLPRPLPVVTADITATADVRKGVCAPGVFGVLRKSSITLLGRRGTSTLGVLPAATGTTLLDCSSGGAADAAVLGLGRGGQLSTRFPKFSYTVREDLTVAVVLLSPLAPPQIGRRPATIPLYLGIRPNLYYVAISGILFGSQPIPMKLGTGGGVMQMSLSTAEPFTYLESGAYGQFKMALISKIQEYPMVRIVPSLRFPADELCYVSKDLTARLPPFMMTILFAGGMVLTSDKLWYEPEQGSPTVCMAILPATLHRDGVPILGTRLQSGRTMTIDLTSAQGTLTF